MPKLDVKEAYLAMYSFLEIWNNRGRTEEIDILLGAMSLLSDGNTADAGVWDDWLRAIEKVRNNEVDASLKLLR